MVPAQLEHAQQLAPHVSQSDREELWQCAHLTPHESLEVAIRGSDEAWVACDRGIPFAAGGVTWVHLMPGLGVAWLIRGDLDRDQRRFLLRKSRAVVRRWRRTGELRNFVAAANTTAIQWLSWLGAQIEDPIPYGVERAPFCPFTIPGGIDV